VKRIDLIAGARPNFMKIAPIIEALKAAEARGGALRYRLIHTGQHYDKAMSGSFFEQLGIPQPDINLEVGSGILSEVDGSLQYCLPVEAWAIRGRGYIKH
jgi:UDP-N-acetylglucosamine 2-epimerase (non-hydrolysing)